MTANTVRLSNHAQAYALALLCGVMAPTTEKASDCIIQAEEIGAGMKPHHCDLVRDVVEVCLSVLQPTEQS